MGIYISLYGSLALFSLALRSQSQRLFLILLFPLLLVFMGTREEVGCDFSGYFNRFLLTPIEMNARSILTTLDEPLFWIINYIVRSNDLSYMWLNLFSSFIILLCVTIYCWAFKNSLLIVSLLFPVFILQLAMSGLRQALAAGFIMLAALFWRKSRRTLVAFSVLVAAQFHTSAIIFAPLAFFPSNRFSYSRIVIFTFLAAPIVIWGLGDRLETYTDRYLSGELQSGGAGPRYILILFPIIWYWLNRKYFDRIYPDMIAFFRLTVLLVISLAPVLIFSSILAHRLIFYIMPFSIVVAAYIFSKNKTVPMMFYGAYMVSWFTFSSHANRCYIPYDSYLL